MPTNPNAPFGFKCLGQIDGSPPNFGNRNGLIITTNLHKIFTGDVLKPMSAGYYDVATEVGGGEPVGGVASWFSWNSTAAQKIVRQNWWPGNGDAIGDVSVTFDGNQDNLFLVQCLLGPITQASVGLNANFNVGGGGQTVGTGNFSSFTLDDGTLGAGPTLPFRVYRLPVQTTGAAGSLYVLPGSDPTNAYNQVWATFNNLVA